MSKVTVCQKCGDHGFAEALTFCVECQSTAEHLYCLDKLPERLNEDVIWTCQDCISRVTGQSNLDNPSPAPSVTSEYLSSFRRQEKSYVTYSSSLEKVHSCESWPSIKPGEVHIWDSTKFDQSKVSCSHLQEENMSMSFGNENRDQLTTCDPPNNSEPNCHVHAQPISSPIWRGSLCIYNEKFGTVNGLAAHLSNQAWLDVSEVACLLPELLPLEMLSLHDVWPRRFGGSEAADAEIGLYFFPEKERDEQAYDRLVDDMIGQELAMKAVVDSAELFLFTSIQLALQHWRFQGKYYLWGLFSKRELSFPGQPEKNVISSGDIECGAPLDPADDVCSREEINLIKI